MTTLLNIKYLDICPYKEVWELQKNLQRQRIQNDIPDTLILCEHPATITAGTSTKRESLLVSAEDLANRGVAYFNIERGGDITYHAPGQLIAYPILDLNHKKRDVHWYMRSLEQVIIDLLEQFQLPALRIPGRTGVWTQGLENAKNLGIKPRKIASIGVRISRWCTMHGLALNVLDLSQGFSLINPCGFQDIETTSMSQEAIRQSQSVREPFSVEKVHPVFIKHFCRIFDCQIDA